MDAGEKLVLWHILEKNGYIICEAQEDIDPRIITVKLWHEPMPQVSVLEYAMRVAQEAEGEKGIC